MFTGIIEAIGTVENIERAEEHARLTVSAPEILTGVKLGDSIAVNGTCLTVVEISDNGVSFDAVYETMRKTALGHLATGDPVNLERSMLADGRFGGHIVQGHVDATGSIASIRQVENSYMVYVDVPRDMMRYIVRKGSIAVDGISLTVVDAEDRTFSVSIIPHTWEATNLSSKRAGDPVNIETDIIGKYVEKLVGNTTYAAAPLGIELNPREGQPFQNPSVDLL
ncbi:MAG TPA: riboflavin synthase [Capsulimonadaceae bacterium]|jgi:riboflavin synthase